MKEIANSSGVSDVHENSGIASKSDVVWYGMVWHTLRQVRAQNFGHTPKLLTTPLIKRIPEGS